MIKAHNNKFESIYSFKMDSIDEKVSKELA
jgi:hypothetical protein